MKRAIIAALVALALTSAAQAQQPEFRTGVEAVRVDVSVTDHDKPVTGLQADDFVVSDNGQVVPITSVTFNRQLPLRIVLALDTSGSVQGNALKQLVDASRALIDALRPTDRIAVLTFAGAVKVVSNFDASRPQTLAALNQVRAGGGTALNDALQAAIELVHMDDAAPDARPLVVVCTDGADTASWLDGAQVLKAAQRTDVVVDAIEPPGAATYGVVQTVDALAQASGGRSWPAKSASDLKELFVQALTEMRGRYLLAFSPRTRLRDGWHDSESHARERARRCSRAAWLLRERPSAGKARLSVVGRALTGRLSAELKLGCYEYPGFLRTP